jgi:hypothetical protein
MRAFKSLSTRSSRERGGIPDFRWQRGFWDVIVRDDDQMADIGDYIETNPTAWERDAFHPSRR